MKIEELYDLYLQHPSVQTDTRKLQPGDLFFALKGPNFNGNAFARQALEQGAAYAVIDEEAFAIPGKTILVDDVLKALQLLATHHRREFTIPFIAITGSNGKTTTKELAHAVLSSTHKTYTTEGNLNNHIGVPLTLLKIRPDAEFAIIEMGANHLHEIASYCQIARPTHGLITNCGKAHLEGFGSEEGVRKGKGELYDFLRQYNGGAFVMQDYDYLQPMSAGIQTIVTYGTGEADISGQASKNDPFLSVSFTKGFQGTVDTHLVGGYNLPNVLAAVTIGKFFHIPEENIRKAIEGYSPSNSRSQLMTRGSHQIILDAYNANPSSMKLAIENFAQAEGQNKVLVLGAMAELGKQSSDEHRQIIEVIQQHPWKNVLLVGGEFASVAHPFLHFGTADEAGAWLQAHPLEGASLLIKGSRSTRMEKVLDYLPA
ncbi:UDP-N-acetylmuramoyl-tripeptide--D-alanyl-D-alanine ligase [Paraflavisolibacter sp. H34]|uniref:UDP-N-acetylmuramoyl-tripeptide--D-alanyl-D- alanine ligase n=1 Tax=Huijunlia imazamoxiresistens TaxID=3127457 RepID=UPI0030185AA2